MYFGSTYASASNLLVYYWIYYKEAPVDNGTGMDNSAHTDDDAYM